MLSVGKLSMTMQISDEQLFNLISYNDKRYERKVANRLTTPPTHSQMREYRRAQAAMRVLQSLSEYVDWGSPESEPEVIAPTDHITIIYAETHDEWLARCRALRQETT
jgi:hypothetical protein